jgi:hypothetical protein
VVNRLLAGFANINAEAEEHEQRMFESYEQRFANDDDDPGDWALEARDQAIDYWVMLSELRQATLNLLAIFLFHLFEQHRNRVTALCKQDGMVPPDFDKLITGTQVAELALVANAAKHADGSAARRLQAIRPDLFRVPGVPEKLATRSPLENPLGGTDLFVSREDLQIYRDALRDLWERLAPML